MRALLKNKFFIVLLGGILLMFFNLSVKKIPLSNRGVVIGFGVDKGENGEGYIVTAQTILSAEKGGNLKSDTSVNFFLLEGKGDNMNEAILKIASQSAITPAFKDCTLIIFGKDLTPSDIDYVSEYFFSDNVITDHTMLVRSNEKASESLKKNIPNTTVLTFHLSRMLNPKYAKLNINAVNLREFIVAKHSKTVNYVPVFKSVEAIAGDSSEGDSQSKKEYYFDIFSTSVLSDNGIVDLTKEETAGLSIIKGRISEGTIDISSGERKVSYTVTSINSSVSYDYNNLKMKVKITAVVKLNDILENGKLSSNIVDLTNEDAVSLQNKLDNDIQHIFAFCKRENLDIIGLYEGYYAKGGNKFKNSTQAQSHLENSTLETSYDIYIT